MEIIGDDERCLPALPAHDRGGVSHVFPGTGGPVLKVDTAFVHLPGEGQHRHGLGLRRRVAAKSAGKDQVRGAALVIEGAAPPDAGPQGGAGPVRPNSGTEDNDHIGLTRVFLQPVVGHVSVKGSYSR